MLEKYNDYKFFQYNEYFYYLIYTIYFIDILINFNTAYYSKGCLITDKVSIFKNYLGNGFFLDLSN